MKRPNSSMSARCFSPHDGSVALALALLVAVSLFPGVAGRLRLGRRDLRRGAGDPRRLRAAQHLGLAGRHQERGPLLAARLFQLLVGAQAVGAEPGRLPRRQHRPAPAQLPAALAPHAAPAGARRSGDRGGVRRASRARGVGGLDHRAQGRAVGAVLPGRGAGLDPFRPDAAAGALRAGPGPVYGGAAVQIGGGDAACGALDLALVAAGEGDADRPACAWRRSWRWRWRSRPAICRSTRRGSRWSWATRWWSGR